MKVLLISAMPGWDPTNGDITYTQCLLENPPEGVSYETYPEALANGRLKEHFTRRSAQKLPHSSIRYVKELCGAIAMKPVNLLRRSRRLFSEHLRFFSVEPGAYDLVHLHVLHAAFLNLQVPLVVSAGGPLQRLYKDARNWSDQHLDLADYVEGALSRLCKVNSSSHFLPQTSRLITYTEEARDWFVNARVMPCEKIDVIPIPLATSAKPKTIEANRLPRKVLFIAKDFVAKGGDTLIEAFKLVRQKRPDAELHVIGSAKRFDDQLLSASKIIWSEYIPREQLMDMLPSYDVFAYPTEFDFVPYVLVECMAAGLPICGSDYTCIPEAIGSAGLVSPVRDCESLANNILKLLDRETNQRYSQAAYEHFRMTYSPDVVHPKLLSSYRRAIAEG